MGRVRYPGAIATLGAVGKNVKRIDNILASVVHAKTHIAVFRFLYEIVIFAVLIVRIEKSEFWYRLIQFFKLFEKRPVKIEIAAVRKRVPLVRPPFVLAVDLERFVGRVDRNDILSRRVAMAFVKFSIVPKGEPALSATIRTEGRSWDGVFYSVKDGGDLVVESEVFVGDGKLRRTMPALAGFGEGFGWGDQMHGNGQLSDGTLAEAN